MVFFGQDFLTPLACARIRDAMNSGDVEPAAILDAAIDVNDQVRRASSIEIEAEVLAFVDRNLDAWRDRLADAHQVLLESREGASFVRYPPGGFYRRHLDRAESAAWPDAARRRLAVVAFLNDDFSGGELKLYPENGSPIVVRPRAGLMVGFDASMPHEVLPVIGGSRDTIVDWWY